MKTLAEIVIEREAIKEAEFNARTNAIAQFKKGDRVLYLRTKEVGTYLYQSQSVMPDVWVKFDSDLEVEIMPVTVDPLQLKLCSPCLTLLPGLEEQQLPETVLESRLLSLSKSTATLQESCEVIGQISLSTTISEPTTQNQKSMTFTGSHSPAPTHPAPGIEPELTANLVDSGLKPCESSTNANPDLSLSKIPQDYSIEEWEQSFKAYPKAGTFVNGRLSPQQPLERPTLEKGYLLSPTLTSGDRTPNSRAAGQTKCEIWFRKNFLLADSHCLSPQMMALLQGFPPDWTKCLWESQEEPLDELKADTSMEDVSAPPKLPLPLEGSSTLIVLDELTIDEERDFAHLERKVEQAFIKAELVFRDAVFALKEIRDRKLYRNTCPTFEEYCKVRFGFSRRRPYQLIDAAVVLENLENPDLKMCTKTEIGTHLLPTNERQIRDLVDLSPEEQVTVWGKAISNGKIPSGEKINDTLDAHIRERLNQPPIPTYIEGDVVEIRSGGSPTLREHDGMWGIVTEVLPSRYKVYISLRNTEVRCKGNELEKVDEKHTVEIQIVSDRIKKLIALGDLDSSIWWILEGLARQTCFTETQMELLEWVEKRYGLGSK